jgi:AraC-like DNA-binding protein
MSRPHYISISLYAKMLHQALHEGLEEKELEYLPTPFSSINTIKAVPAEHFFELHEILDTKLGAGFSVRVGQKMQIEDYGVLGLSWRTCSWAGEIFDRCERYFKLLSDTYVFRVDKGADISHVHLLRDAHRRGVELSNEATLSATVVVLKAMTEKDISPIEVTFKHGKPRNLSDYKEAFSCPVLFDQPKNTISYKTYDLTQRTAKADVSINKFLLERVEEETKGITVGLQNIVSDTERLVKDALPSGIPSVQQIATHMGLSSRTLTRRLATHSLSFRDVIKKTQLHTSQYLLTRSTTSLTEIAFETGFSDQTAFTRAFKRWTNVTPAEYRRVHGNTHLA